MIVVAPVLAVGVVLGRFLQVKFKSVQNTDRVEPFPWLAEREADLLVVRDRARKVVDKELWGERCDTRLHRAHRPPLRYFRNVRAVPNDANSRLQAACTKSAKSHPRQWVVHSDAFYPKPTPQRWNPTNGSWWFIQMLSNRSLHRSVGIPPTVVGGLFKSLLRKDLNYPPIAMGGIKVQFRNISVERT